MRIRILVMFLCIARFLPADSPCVIVQGDQILVSDLARAIPAFARVAPISPLAPSPLPGNTRTFSFSELQAFGSRLSVSVPAQQTACFQIEMKTLDIDRVAEAMRSSLNIPDARIEILETSPSRVPVGSIEFTRDNLGAPSSRDSKNPVPWRGDIVFGGSHRFAIWAKVRIAAPVREVVAVEALRPGVAIASSQLRTEVVEGFPSAAPVITSTDQVVGLMPLRPVAAGAEVRLENLVHPNDVNRGDLVTVDVRFGAAHLSLTGRAESAGRIGDTVAVRNPDTSKVFQAMVEGLDRVTVGRRLVTTARVEGE